MAIRSGRFQSTTSHEAITIVKGRTNSVYRILNSGSVPFDVATRGAGGNERPVVTLAPTFSIDVSTDGDIEVKGNRGDHIAGIYEILSPHHDVRSGRFEFEFGATAHPIVDLTDGTDPRPTVHYRIFNSGNSEFSVTKAQRGEDSDDLLLKVPVGQSRDFAVPSDEPVLSIKARSGRIVQGSYDVIEIERAMDANSPPVEPNPSE